MEVNRNMNEKQIKEIRNFAIRKYEELDYSHGVKHALMTEKLAEYIARKEGADVLICRLGALLHQYHPEEVFKVAEFLKNLGIEEEIREKLVNCVESVSRSTIHKAKTLEAKVVFDADKLQLIGPFGIIRQVAHLIETKKMTYDEAIKKAKEMQDDVFNRLQTETAKKLAKKPYQETLKFLKIFEEWNKCDLLREWHA
jgi:uncharacterized protein